MFKKRLFAPILLLAVFLVVASFAASCTSPSLPPPPPKKSTTLTYTISDDIAIQLITKLIGDTRINFLPGNKAFIGYGGFDYTVSIEAIEGELCLVGIEPVLNRYGTGRFSKYLKKSENDGKVHLIALWFDPRTELNADSDKLPFIESVTTRDGQATFTYRKP